MSIPILWNDFETHLIYKCHRKPETIPRVRRTFLRLKNYFEDKELKEETVFAFFDHLRHKGIKNSTINDYLKFIHHFGKILNIKEIVEIRYLPVEDQLFDVLTPNEVRGLLTTQPERKKTSHGVRLFIAD